MLLDLCSLESVKLHAVVFPGPFWFLEMKLGLVPAASPSNFHLLCAVIDKRLIKVMCFASIFSCCSVVHEVCIQFAGIKLFIMSKKCLFSNYLRPTRRQSESLIAWDLNLGSEINLRGELGADRTRSPAVLKHKAFIWFHRKQ